MQVGIFQTQEAAADYAAAHIIDVVGGATDPVLGVATGSTPLKLYERLRAAHAAGTFTLAGKKAIALDEYVGIADDHPERYRNVLRTELVGEDKTGLTDELLFTPDSSAPDPQAAAARYDEQIRALGGATIQILGIGSDGHIAFNEPGGSLVSRTHVDVLTAQTRTDNARFFDGDLAKVPTESISQGLGTIMEAKEIILLAFGEGKARAVKELVEGAVSAKWPATVLQMHPKVTVLVDEAAASQLELADFYTERWNARH
ncbi:glucosamine-6-phosphate deaminase [Arcanobacterium wilhelmae]|uniref:Glucosamine-6-phosphate deaminase n=1 Tax=Arcanobacterium wilhelmae TaxID=1803177 RepID=A0ABT9N9Y2_9ACTO|nr:glucosamine-6-phosphate deaminase [Arcanobacterium wilhelmae]MDP9800524.1 glucosamine-6-phosphate deaminase [Arcanobacterium wilhelmae]WFN89941.1 glucosamine-6-phosphate deaminase [Arcanobacterium wilhelmae]